mmetsp:Transcript_8277/g.19563  ORF Transcript_8277/g.19563 Transcript_8277/m.19563 type:complete len:101 (-) Transcript_8277:123-425(-)
MSSCQMVCIGQLNKLCTPLRRAAGICTLRHHRDIDNSSRCIGNYEHTLGSSVISTSSSHNVRRQLVANEPIHSSADCGAMRDYKDISPSDLIPWIHFRIH